MNKKAPKALFFYLLYLRNTNVTSAAMYINSYTKYLSSKNEKTDFLQ
jgi:hypothetical protein